MSQRHMSRAAKSVFVFGIYITVVGSVLIVAPNALLSISGLDPASDVWVRVTGMLTAILGFYYIQSARQEAAYFFRLSIYGRIVPSFVFGIFVLLGLAKWPLVLFSTIDISCAAWTAMASRRDGSSASNVPPRY